MTGPWRPADPDAVRRAYLDGARTGDLARDQGVHPNVLARFLRRSGVPLRGGRWQADEADVIPAYLLGESLQSLAKRHGVTPNAVRNHLTRRGVSIRGVREAQLLVQQRRRQERA